MACIAMSPLIREKFAPALIHTYCSVDIVEGLDVDKEEFDKFASRFERPCQSLFRIMMLFLVTV